MNEIAERYNCVSNPATGKPNGNIKGSLCPGEESLVYNPLENTSGKLPENERAEILFMLAARWADDIRTRNSFESHPTWHFINWPFKAQGEPESVRPLPPNPDNILTAFAENERGLRSKAPDDKRGVALAWLFHLIGDIHQPLHTIQLFTREYPMVIGAESRCAFAPR